MKLQTYFRSIAEQKEYLLSVGEKQAYEWVKAGSWNFRDFNTWFAVSTSEAFKCDIISEQN